MIVDDQLYLKAFHGVIDHILDEDYLPQRVSLHGDSRPGEVYVYFSFPHLFNVYFYKNNPTPGDTSQHFTMIVTQEVEQPSSAVWEQVLFMAGAFPDYNEYSSLTTEENPFVLLTSQEEDRLNSAIQSLEKAYNRDVDPRVYADLMATFTTLRSLRSQKNVAMENHR
jgi:hypothetical protein